MKPWRDSAIVTHRRGLVKHRRRLEMGAVAETGESRAVRHEFNVQAEIRCQM